MGFPQAYCVGASNAFLRLNCMAGWLHVPIQVALGKQTVPLRKHTRSPFGEKVIQKREFECGNLEKIP